MTPREIDATLAEAIGCTVQDGVLRRDWNRRAEDSQAHFQDLVCCCEDHRHSANRRGHPWIRPYYSAPTWETAGQLIEGLKHRNGGILWCVFDVIQYEYRAAFMNPDSKKKPGWASAPNGPKAIAEAARLALGIEAPS